LPLLRISIQKRSDGGAVLRCIRDDGSVTWQKQEGPRAAFFPRHDLTHLAVESVLGYRRGFYGLIAEGWDIPDTEGKGSRGPLPDEAVAVEHLVGLLDLERAGAADWTAEAVNREAAEWAARAGRRTGRPVSDDELARVRSRMRDLFGRWAGVAPGGTLELRFETAGT
jgi:hypothetical protein